MKKAALSLLLILCLAVPGYAVQLRDVTISGFLKMGSTTIDELSTDGTFFHNSDTALPTEKAIKTYVDNNIPANYWDKYFIVYGTGAWPDLENATQLKVDTNSFTMTGLSTPYAIDEATISLNDATTTTKGGVVVPADGNLLLTGASLSVVLAAGDTYTNFGVVGDDTLDELFAAIDGEFTTVLTAPGDSGQLIWNDTGAFAATPLISYSSGRLLFIPTDTGAVDGTINITPSAAITTQDVDWDAIVIDGAALDPTVTGVELCGVEIDFTGVDETNLPLMRGIYVKLPSGSVANALRIEDGHYAHRYTAPSASGAFYTLMSQVLSISNLHSTSSIAAIDVSVAGGSPSGKAVAIATHTDIYPIIQTVGTQSSPSQTEYAGRKTSGGSSWADGIDTEEIFVMRSDEVYIGHATEQFSEIPVILSINGTKSVIPTFWYCTAADSWTQFYPNDDTIGFTQSGYISWIPDSISATWTNDGDPGGAEASAGYWIKIIRTRNIDPGTPTVTSAKTSVPLNYEWDKDGNVEVLSLRARSATLSAGAKINEFSTDDTLGDDSDDAVPTEQAVKAYVGTTVANYEPLLVNEAGLYGALSDVSDFVQPGDVNSVDSAMYVDGSIDHEHLAADVISGMTEVTGDSADYMLVWDATDSALKRIDLGEVLGGAGGTPGGDNTQIQFNAAGSFDGDAAFVWDDTNKYLGLGVAPSYRFHVYGTTGAQTAMVFQRVEDNVGGGNIIFQSADAGPGLRDEDDYLGSLQWEGYDGDQYLSAAYITAKITATAANNDMPTSLVFVVTNDGAAAGTERMRLQHDGYLGIGDMTTVPEFGFHLTGVAGNSAWAVAERSSNDASPAYFVGRHDRAGAVIADDDYIALFGAYGYDGDEYHQLGCLSFEVDGAPGDNDMPGRLDFYTTADGASTWTERMSLRADGKLYFMIGTGINEFSIDDTFAGDSDDAVPTEQAVKAYVDANIPDDISDSVFLVYGDHHVALPHSLSLSVNTDGLTWMAQDQFPAGQSTAVISLDAATTSVIGGVKVAADGNLALAAGALSVVLADGSTYSNFGDVDDDTFDELFAAIDADWPDGGGGGSSFTPMIKTSTYTASADDEIYASTDGGAWTLTLPSTPTLGDTVRVINLDDSFATNNLTVARNGSNIMAVADDMIVNINASFSLKYSDATNGWMLF